MSKRTELLKKNLYYKATLAKRFEKKDGEYTKAVTEYPETIKICMERARFLTESYKATEGEPMVIRRARALKNVLEKMTVYIGDGELIVGNFSGAPNKLPLYPELAYEWIVDGLKKGLDKMLTEAPLVLLGRH